MDRSEIVAALTALGEALDRRGVEGELYLVGGAAIALAYDARRSTRDIDAVFEPKGLIYEAASEILGDDDGFAGSELLDGVGGDVELVGALAGAPGGLLPCAVAEDVVCAERAELVSRGGAAAGRAARRGGLAG